MSLGVGLEVSKSKPRPRVLYSYLQLAGSCVSSQQQLRGRGRMISVSSRLACSTDQVLVQAPKLHREIVSQPPLPWGKKIPQHNSNRLVEKNKYLSQV